MTKKTKKTKKKKQKKQKGGMERSIVPSRTTNEYMEYLRSFTNDRDRVNFLGDLRENEPEIFRSIINSRIPTNPNPNPNPLLSLYPEFDNQLERTYVWEAPDMFDEDYIPNNLTYENCRRLQDYCELYPKKCYLNRNYLQRFVRPCQSLKKIHVDRIKEENKRNDLTYLFFDTLNFVDENLTGREERSLLQNLFTNTHYNLDSRLNDYLEYFYELNRDNDFDIDEYVSFKESLLRGLYMYNFTDARARIIDINSNIEDFLLSLRGFDLYDMDQHADMNILNKINDEKKNRFNELIDYIIESMKNDENIDLTDLDILKIINKFIDYINSDI